MSWRVDKQPDGKLRVFDSVVDDWVAADMTDEEVVELFRAEEMERVERTLQKVRQVTARIRAAGP